MDMRSKIEGAEDDATPSSCSDCVTGGSGTGAASAILGLVGISIKESRPM